MRLLQQDAGLKPGATRTLGALLTYYFTYGRSMLVLQRAQSAAADAGETREAQSKSCD